MLSDHERRTWRRLERALTLAPQGSAPRRLWQERWLGAASAAFVGTLAVAFVLPVAAAVTLVALAGLGCGWQWCQATRRHAWHPHWYWRRLQLRRRRP